MMKHSEAFERLVAEIKPQVTEISIDEVVEKEERGTCSISLMFEEITDEWNEGRAKGAMHLSRGILERDIEKLIPDYDAEIVLYCGGGYRSALAAVNAQKMGYKKILSDGRWHPRLERETAA